MQISDSELNSLIENSYLEEFQGPCSTQAGGRIAQCCGSAQVGGNSHYGIYGARNKDYKTPWEEPQTITFGLIKKGEFPELSPGREWIALPMPKHSVLITWEDV